MDLTKINNMVRKVRVKRKRVLTNELIDSGLVCNYAECDELYAEIEALNERLNPAPVVNELATELPMAMSSHKAILTAGEGDLGDMYFSSKFEHKYHFSRYAGHSCKKDRKNYRPYRKTGSVVKTILESDTTEQMLEAQARVEWDASMERLNKTLNSPKVKMILAMQK